MLRSALFRSLLLAGLCYRAALQRGPCFSRYRHTDIFLHLNPYQQIRQLSRVSSRCSYVIIRTVPTASSLWLPACMRKHSSTLRKGAVHTALRRKGLPPAGTRLQTELGTAWETRRNRGTVASQRIRSEHVNNRLSTLDDGDAVNASRHNSQEDLGQFQNCDASGTQSSTSEDVKVQLQDPPPTGFVGMLIRQLEGTTASSDALKVAFSKRCDRVSFRDCVLSSLRQSAICAGLGVTGDFNQDEEFIFPDFKVSGGEAQETVTRKGEKEKQERSDRNAIACLEKKTFRRPTATGRDCRWASGGCEKPPLPPEYSHTVDGTGSPSSSGANSTHASSGLKDTDAHHAHAKSSGHNVSEGSECNRHVLEAFQLLPSERRAASRYPAGGKPPSLHFPKKPNRKRTASDSLRQELGLHHRSDILVQHITDLQRPLRLPRSPRTVRRKKFGSSRA